MCVFNQILNLFLQRALRQYYIFIFVFFYGVYVLENCIARLNILHLCVTSECMRGYIALLSDFRFGYIFTHTYTSHNTYTIHTHTHIRRLHTYVRTEHTHATLYTFHFGRTVFSLFSSRLSALLLLSSRRLFFVSFEFCIYKQMLFIWNSIAQYKSMYTNVCEKNRDSERETESTFTMDFYTTKMHGKTAHSLCLRTYSRVVR